MEPDLRLRDLFFDFVIPAFDFDSPCALFELGLTSVSLRTLDFADLMDSSTKRRGTKATNSSNPVPQVKKGMENNSADSSANRIL